jgi:hypothetical protein
VIRRPHWRKQNQCVMNRQPSTSILRNDHPENHKGEGSTPNAPHPLCINPNRTLPSSVARQRVPKRDCSLSNLSGGGARLGSSAADATALASRSKLIRSMPRST